MIRIIWKVWVDTIYPSLNPEAQVHIAHLGNQAKSFVFGDPLTFLAVLVVFIGILVWLLKGSAASSNGAGSGGGLSASDIARVRARRRVHEAKQISRISWGFLVLLVIAACFGLWYTHYHDATAWNQISNWMRHGGIDTRKIPNYEPIMLILLTIGILLIFVEGYTRHVGIMCLVATAILFVLGIVLVIVMGTWITLLLLAGIILMVFGFPAALVGFPLFLVGIFLILPLLLVFL
ncbi:MAG TPA: hypothetical protein VFM02_01705 [Candidatus Paceibacterota bacterium]|nr:hypothetical protein [Candidatus Paceibacterota bacterium]